MDEVVALEAFNGVMVGDGCLHRALLAGDPPELCYGVKDSRFTITQSTELYDHMDWLFFLKDAFTELGVEVSPGYPKRFVKRSRGKAFGSSKVLTLTSPWLTEQRREWYPEGLKEVLRDFNFTPVSLANAWMSDGNATRDKRYPTTVNVHLFVQDFSLDSVCILEHSLHNMGILYTGRGTEEKGNSGVTITVLQDSVDAFMDIVSPWVLPSFRYKIKRRMEL